MDIKIFNLALLAGWLLVLSGGVMVHPGWGLAMAGALLIVLTLAGAYIGGIVDKRAGDARRETAGG